MSAFYSHVCDSENSASVNAKVATGKRISKGLADYHLHHKGGAEDIPSMVDLNTEVKDEIMDSVVSVPGWRPESDSELESWVKDYEGGLGIQRLGVSKALFSDRASQAYSILVLSSYIPLPVVYAIRSLRFETPDDAMRHGDDVAERINGLFTDLVSGVKKEVTDSTGTFSLPAAAASILSMVPTFEVASSEPDRFEGFFKSVDGDEVYLGFDDSTVTVYAYEDLSDVYEDPIEVSFDASSLNSVYALAAFLSGVENLLSKSLNVEDYVYGIKKLASK